MCLLHLFILSDIKGIVNLDDFNAANLFKHLNFIFLFILKLNDSFMKLNIHIHEHIV